MAVTYKIGSLALILANDIVVIEETGWPLHHKFSESAVWRGSDLRVTDVSSQIKKQTLKGRCRTRAALATLAAYDVENYDWNADTSDVYLTESDAYRWKVVACSLSWKHARSPGWYEFSLELDLLYLGPKGASPRAATGTASSSPTDISCANAGSKPANFDLVQITGVYSAGNLAAPVLTNAVSGRKIEMADVVMEGAILKFYDDFSVHHTQTDDLSADKFAHNKYSSSEVTYQDDRLVFAEDGIATFRYRLKHPLRQDPVLTMSIVGLVGNPVIEVSDDGQIWWGPDKQPQNGTLIDYPLTKLASSSDFYWRLRCGAGDSLQLTYYSLDSWHSYSGQKPLIEVRAATTDTMRLTFTGGQAVYSLHWYDRYTV